MEKIIKQIVSFILLFCLVVTYLPVEYALDFNGSSKVETVSAEDKGVHIVDSTPPAWNDKSYKSSGTTHYYAAGYRISIYYFGTKGDKNYAPNVVKSTKYNYVSMSDKSSYDDKPISTGQTYAYMTAFDTSYDKSKYYSSANDTKLNSGTVSATYFRDLCAYKSSYYVLNTHNVNYKNIYELKPTDNNTYSGVVSNSGFRRVDESRISTTSSGLKKGAKFLNNIVDNTFTDDVLNFGQLYQKDATKMIKIKKLNKISSWFLKMDKEFQTAKDKNKNAKREDYYKEYIQYLNTLKGIDAINDAYIDMIIDDVKDDSNSDEQQIHSYIQVEPVVVMGDSKSKGFVATYSEARFAAKNGLGASKRGPFSYRSQQGKSDPVENALTTKGTTNTVVLKNNNNKKVNYPIKTYKSTFNKDTVIGCAFPILGYLYQSHIYVPYVGATQTSYGVQYHAKSTLLVNAYTNRSGIGFFGLGYNDRPPKDDLGEVNATVNLLYDGEVSEDSLDSSKGNWQATTAVTEIVLSNGKTPSMETVNAGKWGKIDTDDLVFTKYIDYANSKVLHRFGTMYSYVKNNKTNTYKATSVNKYSSVGAADSKLMNSYSTVAYYTYLVTNKGKKRNVATISSRLDSAVKNQLLSKDKDGNYNLKSVWNRAMVSSGTDSSLNAGFTVNLRSLGYKGSSAAQKIVNNGILLGNKGVFKTSDNYKLGSVLTYPIYDTKYATGAYKTIKVEKKNNGDTALSEDEKDTAVESNTYLRYNSNLYSSNVASLISSQMSLLGSNKSLATQAYYLQCVNFKGLLGTQTTQLQELTKIAAGEQFALNILVGAKLGDVTSYYTWAVYDFASKSISSSGTTSKTYDISSYAQFPVGSYSKTKSDGTVEQVPITGIKRILIVPNRSNTGVESKDMAISQEELENAVSSGCANAEQGEENAILKSVHSAIVANLNSKASEYGKVGSELRDYFERRLNASSSETYNSSDIATVGFYQNESAKSEESDEDVVDDNSVVSDDEDKIVTDTSLDTETTLEYDEEETITGDGIGDLIEPESPFANKNDGAYLNGTFETYDITGITKEDYLKGLKSLLEKKSITSIFFYPEDEKGLYEYKVSELDKIKSDVFDSLCRSLADDAVYVKKLSEKEQDFLINLTSEDDSDLEDFDVSVIDSIESKSLASKLKLDDDTNCFVYLSEKILGTSVGVVDGGYDESEESFEIDNPDGLNNSDDDLSSEDEISLDGGEDLKFETGFVDKDPSHQRGYTVIAYGTKGKVTTSVGIDLQPWELNYVYADLQAAVMGANEQKITEKNATQGVFNWNAFVRTHSDDVAQTVRARVGGYIYSLTGSRGICTDGPHNAKKEESKPHTSFAWVDSSAWAVWCSGWSGEDYATNNIIVSDTTSGRSSTIDSNESNGNTNWAYQVNKNALHANEDNDTTLNHYSLFLYTPETVNQWYKHNASYAVDTKQDKNTKPYWSVWSRISKNFNYLGSGYEGHYFTVNTLYETAYFSYVYNLIRYISGDMRNVSAFYNYDSDYATVRTQIKNADDIKHRFVEDCLQFAYNNIPDTEVSYVTSKKYTSGSARSAFTYRFANNESGAKDYISEHVILQSYMQDDGDNIRYHALGSDWQNPKKTVNNVDIQDADKKNQNIKYCDIFYTYQENSQKPFYHYLDHSWSSKHYNQTIQWTKLVATSAAPEDSEHCHNIAGEYHVYVCDGHKYKVDEHADSTDRTKVTGWHWGTSYCSCSNGTKACSNSHAEARYWTYDISQFNAKCYHERCIGGSMAPAFETRIVTVPTKDKKGTLQAGKHETNYKLNYKEYIYKYVTSAKHLGVTTKGSGLARLTDNGDYYVSGKSLGDNNGQLGNLSYGSNTNSHITTNFASAYLDSAKDAYKANSYGVEAKQAVFAYYPEVNMIGYGYKRGQQLQGGLSGVTPYIVPTVSEIERGTISASLNIMSIKDVNYDNKDTVKKTGTADYEGTTLSDTIATGTQASDLSQSMNLFNSNKSIRQVIYAGSDVTVTGNANFKLTLYGYAMDLIKPEDGNNNMLTVAKGDGTADTMARSYSYIVANNANLYQLWFENIHNESNKKHTTILPIEYSSLLKYNKSTNLADTNYNILKNRYQAWVDRVTNLNNWYADYTLDVHKNNSSYAKYTDFNATIGTLTTADNKKSTDATLTKQTNVYPLHIKNGEIIKNDAGYVAFINQLARDYFGDTDKDITTNYVTLTHDAKSSEIPKAAKLKDYDRAEKLFENSDLASCVTNAIEHAKSPENVSGTASDRTNTAASELGTSKSTSDKQNWYDEEVRTIVLRRFKTESLYFNNITASDKLEYSLSEDSNTTVDTWTGMQADWYLNLYYKDDNTDTNKNFNTSTISDTNVANKLEVIRNLYVDNASFIIPSATTDNMGW